MNAFNRTKPYETKILKERSFKMDTKSQDGRDLVCHLIDLIESDETRYSFEWSCGNAIEIFDKEKEIGYVLHVDKIKYDENGDATNI